MRRAFTLQLYKPPIFGDADGRYPHLIFECPGPDCTAARMRVGSVSMQSMEHLPGMRMTFTATCAACPTTANFDGFIVGIAPGDCPTTITCTDYTVTAEQLALARRKQEFMDFGIIRLRT